MAADEAEAEVVRQVTADLPDTERLVARVAHLRTIVAWADTVHQTIATLATAPGPEWTRFEAALTLAHHVLADRDDPDKGDKVLSGVDHDCPRWETWGLLRWVSARCSVDADSETADGPQRPCRARR